MTQVKKSPFTEIDVAILGDAWNGRMKSLTELKHEKPFACIWIKQIRDIKNVLEGTLCLETYGSFSTYWKSILYILFSLF